VSPPTAPESSPALNNARWFAAEVQPHESDLRSYLRRHFPALSDIDDLVQETYIRVFRAYSLGKVNNARPYLFVTARNAALDLCRRKQITPIACVVESEHLFVVEDKPDPAEALSREQKLSLLVEAIESLPRRCRLVLKLRKLHGQSHRQIAEKLGISEHTVNAQIAKGVVRCREYFLARGLIKNDEP
jgi:RNA polymerase sigma-70 factor (ECF subfamily)